jgi:hypothetical protein
VRVIAIGHVMLMIMKQVQEAEHGRCCDSTRQMPVYPRRTIDDIPKKKCSYGVVTLWVGGGAADFHDSAVSAVSPTRPNAPKSV